MNRLLKLALLASIVQVLTACPGKDGDGNGNRDAFVTSANSCLNYIYNQQYGYYMDNQGRRVNCNQGYFNGQNNNFMPYYNYNGSQYQNGCSSWSMYFPSAYYVPILVGGQYMCVNSSYYSSVPGFNNYYAGYNYAYPTYAYSCQYGVNCPASCLSAGIGGGWLGGTLALCW